MTRKKRAGLWAPAFKVLSGSAVATAFGIRLGWKFAVITEVIVLLATVVLYLMGLDDTDTGAILANRVDERQTLIRLRATRLSALVSIVATIVAFVIAVALKASYWPFMLLYFLAVVSYFVGLGVYGGDNEEDAGAPNEQEGHRVTS